MKQNLFITPCFYERKLTLIPDDRMVTFVSNAALLRLVAIRNHNRRSKRFLFPMLTNSLICFLRTGSGQVTSDFSIDSSYGDILIGIVLFFIIGCEFFINYQVCFRKKQKEA